MTGGGALQFQSFRNSERALSLINRLAFSTHSDFKHQQSYKQIFSKETLSTLFSLLPWADEEIRRCRKITSQEQRNGFEMEPAIWEQQDMKSEGNTFVKK